MLFQKNILCYAYGSRDAAKTLQNITVILPGCSL